MAADGTQPILGLLAYGPVGHDQQVVMDRDPLRAVRHVRLAVPDDERDRRSIEQMSGTGGSARAQVAVEDESTFGEDLELPGADLSGESLSVRVVPRQMDEFVCSSCFMLSHTSRRARPDADLCTDCA